MILICVNNSIKKSVGFEMTDNIIVAFVEEYYGNGSYKLDEFNKQEKFIDGLVVFSEDILWDFDVNKYQIEFENEFLVNGIPTIDSIKNLLEKDFKELILHIFESIKINIEKNSLYDLDNAIDRIRIFAINNYFLLKNK